MRLSSRLLLGLAVCLIALAGLRLSVQAQSSAVYVFYLPYLARAWDDLTPTPPASATPSATATRTRLPPLHPTCPPTPPPTPTPSPVPPSPTASATEAPMPSLTPTATATLTSTATSTFTPSPPTTHTPTPPPSGQLVLEAVADTFLTEGRPATAWGTFPGLFIGYDWQGWYRQRPLVRFDLAALPADALVISATLEVYIHNCFECYPVEVTTYRVTQPWEEETASWETAAEAYGEAYGRGVLDPSERRHWEAFDVTDLVRTWASGSPNQGVMLRGGEEPVSEDPLRYDFWGIEAREGGQFTPRLVIHWRPQ